MDDKKPKSSEPPLKRHGDPLDDTLRKSGLGGAENTTPKREGQRHEGTEAPREPKPQAP